MRDFPLPLVSLSFRECRGEAHEPCDCETWKLWLQKVTEMKPEECEYLLGYTSCSLQNVAFFIQNPPKMSEVKFVLWTQCDIGIGL